MKYATHTPHHWRYLGAMVCASGIWLLSSCQRNTIPEPTQSVATRPVVSCGATDYGAAFGTWNGRVAIAVLCEQPALRTACGQTNDSVEYHGTHRGVDRDSISWSCWTRDGESGLVEIDGRSFELRDGLLFLVTGSGRSRSIRQLALASTREDEFLRALEDDPLVSGLLQASNSP